MDKEGYVYILTNKRNGTLYIGVTSNLVQRISQHKYKAYDGFTAKYGLDILVWLQEFPTITEAIEREKKLKGWKRCRKLSIIEEKNPHRDDLAESL